MIFTMQKSMAKAKRQIARMGQEITGLRHALGRARVVLRDRKAAASAAERVARQRDREAGSAQNAVWKAEDAVTNRVFALDALKHPVAHSTRKGQRGGGRRRRSRGLVGRAGGN